MGRSSTNGMLSCRDLIEFLDDYVEERLPRAERERFDHHLSLCDACVRYLKGYRGTLHALALVANTAPGTETGSDIPEEVPRELIDAILATRRAAS